jgi:hypothetical protein
LREYYGVEIGIIISISLITFLAFLNSDFVVTSELGIIGIGNLIKGTIMIQTLLLGFQKL